MKRKGVIAIICIIFASIIVLILLTYFNRKNTDDNIDVKNISLVYRKANYAYDGKDELYAIEKNGTIHHIDMRNNNYNTTLIATVNLILQDSDTIIGKSEGIPESIIDSISLPSLSKLKYNSELGSPDAPESVYYILVETNTAIELIKIANYGGNNISSDFKMREETEDYIDNVISSVK